MFARLSSAVQSAVGAAAEVLAPACSLREEFVYHWKVVTNHLISHRDDRQPVQASSLPEHLHTMVELLCRDEEESDGASVTFGPCMEYLLQHKILETLHTLGRADCPPGMKQQVLQFFTAVLGRIQQPLLPQIHINKPVQRLIHCCDARASPIEADEVQFLCTVTSKLKEQPHLGSLFLESRPISSSGESTPAATPSSPPRQPDIGGERSKFHLLLTLLELSKSSDTRVSLKACEGLLLCASLENDRIAQSIVSNSPFCHVLTDRLRERFCALPDDLPSVNIPGCSVKWGMEGGTEDEDFIGRSELQVWLSWLDYFDQVALSAHPAVAEGMMQTLRERFLLPVIEQRLRQASEDGVVVTTMLLSKLLQCAAPVLVKGLCHFILGDDEKHEKKESIDENSLRRLLISHCDHMNDEISLAALQLFSTLLKKNEPHVISSLVLCQLVGQRYMERTESNDTTEERQTQPVANGISNQSNSGDLADDVVANGAKTEGQQVHTDGGALSQPAGDEPQSLTQHPSAGPSLLNSSFVSPTSEPEAIMQMYTDLQRTETVVTCILTLVPEVAKSSNLTGGVAYDTYVRDAQLQVSECFAACRRWPPFQPVGDSEPDTFFEGFFLHILFNRLQRILEQPYEINLAITGLLAQLAYFPHPDLHKYLLDPYLTLADGCRSLFQILRQVCAELTVHVQRMPGFQHSVVECRRRLLGLSTSDLLSMPHNNLLEGAVVLEEVCKELAAIVYVKAAMQLHDYVLT